MSTPLRAIFFDLGGTLVTQNIEDNLVTRQALQRIASILPKPTPPSLLYKIYREGYRVNETLRSRHHVEIPIQAWMLQLLRRALMKEPPDNLVERAINIIVSARAANAVAFEDAQPTLKRLSECGIKLGVISNISSHEVAVQILRNVRVDRYIDQLTTSAYTGIRKPDPGIFLYALLQLRLRPKETIHVGDSEEHDVRGAKASGMRTVLIARRGQRGRTIADYHFSSLAEARDLLESL